MRHLRAFKELGLPALSHYALYSLALRLGYFRWRLPIRTWDELKLFQGSPPDAHSGFDALRSEELQVLPFDLKQVRDLISPDIHEGIQAQAKAIEEGKYSLFGITDITLGRMPHWHAYPPFPAVKSSEALPATHHWSHYNLAALPGDIKLVWEPSRFGWAFPLLQAYALTKDEKYAALFWTLLDLWMESNPPNAGVQWSSAQEVAFRLIALLFAAYTLADTSDADRKERLLRAIVVHAGRIPPSLAYARAQNNNHLLVESAGLYLTGLALPGLKKAGRWKRIGRANFERALEGQVFPDGGYVQHSTNYQRLVLQLGILVGLGAERAGEPLGQPVLSALQRLATCLAALVDEDQGQVPNFGPNDGGMLLPISLSPFEDYRPTIQAAWTWLHGEGRFPGGTWDDFRFWLGIETPQGMREREIEPALKVDLPQAGLYITQSDKLKTVLRAAEFRNRPGHSDQLHLEVWYQGINLARDPGSYLYNADQPWRNAFSGAWCHNTVMLDQQEPMRAGGRFLWLDWSQASVIRPGDSDAGLIRVLFAQHRSRLWPDVVHQRTVLMLGDEQLVVADELVGKGTHQATLNWSLADMPWAHDTSSLTLQHSAGSVMLSYPERSKRWGLFRAGERVGGELRVEIPEIYGWHAPTYACKVPGLQLVVELEGELPMRALSHWQFQEGKSSAPEIEWEPLGANSPAFRRVKWGPDTWVS